MADTLPTYPFPALGNQHSRLARQEKGQGTHPRTATGSLLERLPLPHVLIHSWQSRSISQVQVPCALGSLDGPVVDFVELFHDELQVGAEMRGSCEAPEQRGQVQEYGKQQQDVGEELESKSQLRSAHPLLSKQLRSCPDSARSCTGPCSGDARAFPCRSRTPARCLSITVCFNIGPRVDPFSFNRH